ncbi:MAG: hypothetical protein AAFX85_19855 [Pseudomonadota bacterium]
MKTIANAAALTVLLAGSALADDFATVLPASANAGVSLGAAYPQRQARWTINDYVASERESASGTIVISTVQGPRDIEEAARAL